jgi:transcriptional regulator with GAF, ATPase, and Fis domain
MNASGYVRHDESGSLDGLITEASSVLLRLTGHCARDTVEAILRRIAQGIDVDRAVFIQSSEGRDAVEAAYAWSRQADADHDVDTGAPCLKRLLERLPFDGGALASGDMSEDASAELFPSASSALAIPVAVGRRCRSVLVVEALHAPRTWPASMVQRLRLLAEMLAAAMHRLAQERALHRSRIETERLTSLFATDAEPHSPPPCTFDDIVGSSVALRAALGRVQQVATTDSTVLLLGETGTGKELFARAIHANSPRRGHPLVTLNAAALPAALVESELFGHERGAFTGAVAERAGRFELAHRGTLFLDEIGDLPLEIQSKLLRVLQDRTFERLGSSQTRRMNVRIIAATHHNLADAVAEGRFRADLYYRLSVFPIRLPPLRDRPEDVPALVWAIVRKRQHTIGRAISHIAPGVMHRLQAYGWPGNVRELENVIERALINSSGDAIAQLDADVIGDTPGAGSESTTLVSVERTYIEQVLHECGWRINGSGNAAERLGLHPNTLRFRMKKLGIVRTGLAPAPSLVQPAHDHARGGPLTVRAR